jgi:hypothetical protein
VINSSTAAAVLNLFVFIHPSDFLPEVKQKTSNRNLIPSTEESIMINLIIQYSINALEINISKHSYMIIKHKLKRICELNEHLVMNEAKKQNLHKKKKKKKIESERADEKVCELP